MKATSYYVLISFQRGEAPSEIFGDLPDYICYCVSDERMKSSPAHKKAGARNQVSFD